MPNLSQANKSMIQHHDCVCIYIIYVQIIYTHAPTHTTGKRYQIQQNRKQARKCFRYSHQNVLNTRLRLAATHVDCVCGLRV